MPITAAGLESTLDMLITFSDLNHLESFLAGYDGSLSPRISEAFTKISEDQGGEVSIDGKKDEAKKLARSAEDSGADIKYSLGGNGIQEAVALSRLGSDAFFLGGLSKKIFFELPQFHRKNLGSINTEFAKIFEESEPTSYIIQVSGKNRYILSEGEGRRINQLGPYLGKLPSIIRKIESSYGKLDGLSLVGWHVLFGNGLNDEDLKFITDMVEKIHEVTNAFIFTDAGGLDSLKGDERMRLSKIYSLFDIISVNEEEVFLISEALGEKEDDEILAMYNILQSGKNLETVWLHTSNYQASLSNTYSEDILERAQILSALAGVHKVETGNFPDMKNLEERRRSQKISKTGIKKARQIRTVSDEINDDKNFVVTPCYRADRFFSTTGAGDVSAASYVYSLAKGHRS